MSWAGAMPAPMIVRREVSSALVRTATIGGSGVSNKRITFRDLTLSG